jgi:hypothetical protein
MQLVACAHAWKGDIPKKRNFSRALQLPVASRINLELFETDGDSSNMTSYQAESIPRHQRELLERSKVRFHCRVNFPNYIENGYGKYINCRVVP